jgi:phosphoglycolate phosphatase
VEQPDAIVFDFDLTLADSSEGFVASHGFAARQVGLPPPDAAAILRTIGTPLVKAVPMLYGEAVQPLAEEYVRIYQSHADEVMTGLTRMLPGAVEAVRCLHHAGVRMAIVSQKLRYRVVDVLQREGLLECFEVVLGGEDLPEFKPDPRGLLLALDRLGAAPERALFVGDTTIDAETAQRAGVRFVGVLTGVTSRAELEAYRPVAVLDSVSGLPHLFGLGEGSAPRL